MSAWKPSHPTGCAGTLYQCHRDPPYVVAALLGGAIAFAVFSPVNHIPSWILSTLDVSGLSLFAVSGASKARCSAPTIWRR